MKTIILAMTVFAMFGFTIVVWAQEQITPATSSKTAQTAKDIQFEKTPVLRGEIVSVDTTANLITVKKSGKDETLAVDPNALVKKAGKTITLKDLSPNEKVDLRYKTEAGKKIVMRISVVVSPTGKQHASKNPRTASAPK